MNANAKATHTALRVAIVTALIAIAATIGINTATTAHATTTNNETLTYTVTNHGEQDAVDACTGGLTHMDSVSEYLGKNYLPIHNNCGGAPILNLTTGDQVQIDGTTYTVIATTDVQQGDTATTLTTLPGDTLIQTCHTTGTAMRVVSLTAN